MSSYMPPAILPTPASASAGTYQPPAFIPPDGSVLRGSVAPGSSNGGSHLAAASNTSHSSLDHQQQQYGVDNNSTAASSFIMSFSEAPPGPHMAAAKMFVGGLPQSVTSDTLRDYFGQYGEINEAFVLMDEQSGRSRGFGFVTFTEPSSLNNVLASKPHMLDGKTVDCKHAVLKGAGGGGNRPAAGQQPAQPQQNVNNTWMALKSAAANNAAPFGGNGGGGGLVQQGFQQQFPQGGFGAASKGDGQLQATGGGHHAGSTASSSSSVGGSSSIADLQPIKTAHDDQQLSGLDDDDLFLTGGGKSYLALSGDKWLEDCAEADERKIFVGGLPDVTPAEFAGFFEHFGPVADAMVMFDRKRRRQRGFGFITFGTNAAVHNALQYHRHPVKGKLVEVKKAHPLVLQKARAPAKRERELQLQMQQQQQQAAQSSRRNSPTMSSQLGQSMKRKTTASGSNATSSGSTTATSNEQTAGIPWQKFTKSDSTGSGSAAPWSMAAAPSIDPFGLATHHQQQHAVTVVTPAGSSSAGSRSRFPQAPWNQASVQQMPASWSSYYPPQQNVSVMGGPSSVSAPYHQNQVLSVPPSSSNAMIAMESGKPQQQSLSGSTTATSMSTQAPPVSMYHQSHPYMIPTAGGGGGASDYAALDPYSPMPPPYFASSARDEGGLRRPIMSFAADPYGSSAAQVGTCHASGGYGQLAAASPAYATETAGYTTAGEDYSLGSSSFVAKR